MTHQYTGSIQSKRVFNHFCKFCSLLLLSQGMLGIGKGFKGLREFIVIKIASRKSANCNTVCLL